MLSFAMLLSLNLPASSAHEASPGRIDQVPNGHVIGLVSIPPKDLAPGADQEPANRKLPVFDSPKPGAKILKVVTDLRQFNWEEFDDAIRPLVYERSKDFVRVGLEDAPAWIALDDHLEFTSLFEVLKGQQAYLRSDWDRRLWPDPTVAKQIEMSPPLKPEQRAVEVLAERTIDQKLWFKIRFERTRCGYNIGSGKESWIPAYVGPSNAPNVWYNPKGC